MADPWEERPSGQRVREPLEQHVESALVSMN
jgi:hypothetical protein